MFKNYPTLFTLNSLVIQSYFTTQRAVKKFSP